MAGQLYALPGTVKRGSRHRPRQHRYHLQQRGAPAVERSKPRFELGPASSSTHALVGGVYGGMAGWLSVFYPGRQGRVTGAINSWRYPQFFELNLHVERRFRFRGHHWAGRVGFNNITNHRNPNTVNNNTASAHFLSFYGGQSRTLNFRIRWLGKADRGL
jgi:hypothetical protein